MSSVNAGNPTSKPAAKSKAGGGKPIFSAKLKILAAAVKDVLNIDEEIGNLDKILGDKKELEAKLQLKAKELTGKENEVGSVRASKDKEIAELQSENAKLKSAKDTLCEEFRDQNIRWHTETGKQAELQNENGELKQKLGDATQQVVSLERQVEDLENQTDNFEDNLEKAVEELKNTKGELGKATRELRGTVANLEDCQHDLYEMVQELGIKDLNTFELTTRFSALATQCHELARKFFFTQLPQTRDPNLDDIWEHLSESTCLKSTPRKFRRFPLSNSPASQYLRMAVAETVIAEKIRTAIFQQYYLPSEEMARRAMDDALDMLYESSHRREAIFRLQLLEAYASTEREHATSVLRSAADDVVGLLSPLFFDPSCHDDFQPELLKLFDEALALWRQVQRNGERGAVLNDPDEDWEGYDYDAAVAPQPGSPDQAQAAAGFHHEGDAIMSLFPQVLINEVIVCPGYALWSTQKMVEAASLELGPLMASGAQGVLTRRSAGKRRYSTVTLSGDRAIATPPASPRSQSRSFLEHSQKRAYVQREAAVAHGGD